MFLTSRGRLSHNDASRTFDGDWCSFAQPLSLFLLLLLWMFSEFGSACFTFLYWLRLGCGLKNVGSSILLPFSGCHWSNPIWDWRDPKLSKSNPFGVKADKVQKGPLTASGIFLKMKQNRSNFIVEIRYFTQLIRTKKQKIIVKHKHVEEHAFQDFCFERHDCS